MPRNVVVSVGILWGRPRRRTCGIFAGLAGKLKRRWWDLSVAMRRSPPNPGCQYAEELLALGGMHPPNATGFRGLGLDGRFRFR